MKSIWFQNPGGCCLIFAEMFNLNWLKSTKKIDGESTFSSTEILPISDVKLPIVLIDVKLPHPCNDFLGPYPMP